MIKQLEQELSPLKRKNKPINITEDIWFYQNERSLDFFVWQTGRDGKKTCVQFRLHLSKLGI